jgi:hypothetical protein
MHQPLFLAKKLNHYDSKAYVHYVTQHYLHGSSIIFQQWQNWREERAKQLLRLMGGTVER